MVSQLISVAQKQCQFHNEHTVISVEFQKSQRVNYYRKL